MARSSWAACSDQKPFASAKISIPILGQSQGAPACCFYSGLERSARALSSSARGDDEPYEVSGIQFHNHKMEDEPRTAADADLLGRDHGPWNYSDEFMSNGSVDLTTG